jgi:hypothetical protein
VVALIVAHPHSRKATFQLLTSTLIDCNDADHEVGRSHVASLVEHVAAGLATVRASSESVTD